MNVNNNCSTGSTALYLARQAVASGLYDCALAVGFEKMKPGPLKGSFPERTSPTDKTSAIMEDLYPIVNVPMNPQMFANAGEAYCQENGQDDLCLDMVAAKNHTHSSLNPYSQVSERSELAMRGGRC
jgi:sterol carrier protein 2